MASEKRITDTLIYSELEDKDYWFDYNKQKFLHSIDTFYYTVKFDNDFTKNSTDIYVKRFREYFAKIDKGDYGSLISVPIPGLDEALYYTGMRFGYFYDIWLQVPEMFEIIFASCVPGKEEDENESDTSELEVQIHSYPLWELGVVQAYRKSFEIVKKICDYFNLTIYEVKENRVDYCWHSNYLQRPSHFFRIDNFIKMHVSRFKRIHYEYQFKPNDEYENDYICLGVKKNGKVFVRIYLKSKEVIEKSYKPWFFKIWLFNGLISRYDNYIYETCFEQNSWEYVNMARLKFYSEYGSNEFYRAECNKILAEDITISPDSLQNLADKLTPRVTLITNVEFQTSRRMSKSFILKQFRENLGVDKRIYDYVDNRTRIIEYLTHDTLRLVEPDADDTNKSRRDYCNFWKRLRQTKLVDSYIPKAKIKLVREYSRKLNKSVVKKRILNGCVTYGLYERGINDDHVFKDCAAALLCLNDNDVFNMMQYKEKKKRLLNKKFNNTDITGETDYEFELINTKTGEYFVEDMKED